MHLHNRYFLNNCNLHLPWCPMIGTPISIVNSETGVWSLLFNPLSIGFLTQNSVLHHECHWSCIGVGKLYRQYTSQVSVSSPYRRVQNDRVLSTMDQGYLILSTADPLDREKWCCYNMWLHNRPGVPGLHILQCSRVGYRNCSSTQCSCQIDSLCKIHHCQLGQASWRSMKIQAGCLEVSKRGSLAQMQLRCVQCFQVCPKFLGVSRCIHPWCDHSYQVCSVKFKLSWCVELRTSHPGVFIQCPGEYMPSR